jgi:N6-adenosine-specific RNA methylase IME4
VKVPGIDRAALGLSRQIGDGVRLCRLLNAFTYLIDSAFIIVDNSGVYRLLVRSYGQVVMDQKCRSHLYLWVPNALIWEGMIVMKCWGFIYKSNLGATNSL